MAPRAVRQGVSRSGLRLPLALPAGLIDLDRNRQRLGAAAVAGAADGSGAEIIEAEGDAGMGVGGANRIRRIEGHPTEIRHEGFGPGVPGGLVHDAVGTQEMAADEARRYPDRARAGDEDVRIVLAYAALQGESLDRRRAAMGRVFIEGH